MYYNILALRNSSIFIVFIVLIGCAQMPHHSNTMFFGTSTTIGVAVNARATSDPSVTLGYERNEGVILPLVANEDFDGEAPTPCKIVDEDKCVLVGESPNGAKDVYSALASFGAKASGRSTSSPEASATVAQYFATGLAARILAENGGAAVVSVGSAAIESAQKSGGGELAKLAKDPQVLAVIAQVAQERNTAKDDLIRSVSETANDATVKDLMDEIDRALNGEKTILSSSCESKAECVKFLKAAGEALGGDLPKIRDMYREKMK